MPVFLFGINHKTAPVEIREKVAFAPDSITQSLKKIKSDLNLDEVAIVSTCNRMEILCRLQPSTESSKSPQAADSNKINYSKLDQQLITWLAEYHHLSPQQIEQCCYTHANEDAINHIMSVACGLDSMVLGEPQILGQVKEAYGYAKLAQTNGVYLNRLFEQTFSLAKQVRTDTQIGESAVSVAYAAVTLAKRIFADFAPIKALFIGAGETIELAARHLSRQGVTQMSVANRTVERAQNLAQEFNAKAYGLSAIPELVAEADIIISSTASPVPVIGKGLMEQAIKKRKHRPVFMVDLAVPRDIESQVGELSDVYLYTVDDMQDVIKENLKVREEAALEAQDIIQLHGRKYLEWIQSLSTISVLKAFRSSIEAIKAEELKRALGKLNQQDDAEQLLLEFANRLTKKFMHSPSKLIREAGQTGQTQVLKVLSEAFDLKQKNED
ncbi:glutamyl-tRNA reductase [Aliikangiella sp. IMCC44653]